MTTKQLATKILAIAHQMPGRLDCRMLAANLGVTAAEFNAALDLLGDKIVRVRGVGAYIAAA